MSIAVGRSRIVLNKEAGRLSKPMEVKTMKTLVKILAVVIFAMTCSVAAAHNHGLWVGRSGQFSPGDASRIPHFSGAPPAPEHFAAHFGHFRGRHHVFFDFVHSSWEWPYDGYEYGRYYFPDYPVYDSGYSVAADVQAVLASRGFYSGKINGIIGLSTRDAIRRYQASWGLPVTGLIDQRLIDSLGLG